GIVIPYGFLERLMRITKNPDYFNGLPSQTAQWVLKNAVNDFFNWLAALKAYDADPSKFTGKPKMPKYCKKDLHTFTITNQTSQLARQVKKRELLVINPQCDCSHCGSLFSEYLSLYPVRCIVF
ncbi:MAG: hypothetical protein IJH64_08345, partial [Oscillospiraceae bacterium]|nr:hypothetical protein [Oscillospiraceae bacterium]